MVFYINGIECVLCGMLYYSSIYIYMVQCNMWKNSAFSSPDFSNLPIWLMIMYVSDMWGKMGLNCTSSSKQNFRYVISLILVEGTNI